MSKTLYVTDLDGTLLQNDQTLSETTTSILNSLLDQGLYFTYATGRSLRSASPITHHLHLTLPVITRDGCILADPKTIKEIEIVGFSPESLADLRPILMPILSSCFATSYPNGIETKQYITGISSQGFQTYLDEHRNDPKLHAVPSETELFQTDICFFKFIADHSDLEPIYQQIKDNPDLSCILQKDNYSSVYWLSIYPKNSSKASAIQKLQKQLGCDRLVVFGDSVNDISMFQIADEAYATANAVDELKAIATDIIGDNNSDSVAKWLNENVQL